MTLCNGSCVDIASNPDHCGGCNHPCNAGDKCEAKACGPAPCTGALTGCPASNSRTACVDLANPFPFCGACGTVCAVDEVCAGSHCQHYAPAAPCSTCPCPACDALVGGPSVCCPGLYGGVDPVCVAGAHCP